MDFENIVQIIETTEEQKANSLLGSGWILLAVAHGMSSAGDGDLPIIKYSLGELCPCPPQWKILVEKAGGGEALAEELGLTYLQLRLLARGQFQPQGSVLQLCRQLCERHNLQPLL